MLKLQKLFPDIDCNKHSFVKNTVSKTTVSTPQFRNPQFRNPGFETGDIAGVERLLIIGFVGEFPDPFLAPAAGPTDAEDALFGAIALFGRGFVGVDAVLGDGFFVDGNA